MALGLRPERALLNDVNPHVINFYRWLQRGLQHRPAAGERRDAYYAHRDRFNALLAPARATAPKRPASSTT